MRKIWLGIAGAALIGAIIAGAMAFALPRAEAPVTKTPIGGPSPEEGSGIALGDTARLAGVSMTPAEVLEDSRCPVGVMCIQAGTVRVRASVVVGTASTSTVLRLGTPLELNGTSVTLEEVAPIRRRDGGISPADYRFFFSAEAAETVHKSAE